MNKFLHTTFRIFKEKLQISPFIEYLFRRSFQHFYLWYRLKYLPANGKSGIKILYINQLGDQEVEALCNANREHTIREIGNGKVFMVARYFFPPHLRCMEMELDTEEHRNARRRYRKIAKKIIDRIQKFYDLDVCLVTSDVYWWIREVIREFQERKIPVVIMEREGICAPYYFENHPRNFKDRHPVIGDYIMTWNHRMLEFWDRAGVNENKLKVIGNPRTDFFFSRKLWKSKGDLGFPNDKPVILFFTYMIHTGIPEEWIENGFKFNWIRMREETHEVLLNLAEKYPDYSFVIKAHPQQLDQFTLSKEINQRNLHNVYYLTGHHLGSQLIVNSDLIIGFQTSALIESMLTDKPIFYTFWGDILQDIRKFLFPFEDTPALTTIKSPEELRKKVEFFIKNGGFQVDLRLKEARKIFVKNYYYEPNGEACNRVFESLTSFVQKWKILNPVEKK